MKKTGKKISLLLALILAFVMMLGVSFAMFKPAKAEPVSEPSVAANGQSSKWYEITVEDDKLTVLLDGSIGNYRSLSAADLKDIKSEIIRAVKTLVIDRLIEKVTGEDRQANIAL